MTEQTKQEAAKEAALSDLGKIKKRPGRPPKAGTIEPIAVSLEDLNVKSKGAGKGLPTGLGAEADEVALKGSDGTAEPAPVKRGPGRPKKLAEAVSVKRGPGRPSGRPKKVVVEGPRVQRRKSAEGGGLLKDYIKRDEAQGLAQVAAERAVAGVYAQLPKLIEKELRKLLK